MKQKELMALLEEAAKPDCTVRRRIDIQCLLRAATVAGKKSGGYEIRGSAGTIVAILDMLYDDTVKNRPEILPSLFPIFALLCGDREKRMETAQIDWSLFI